jgi:crotonobetainyl-CoA:carnitine CoA-transferase CaiB-like acyl-CoA transferase
MLPKEGGEPVSSGVLVGNQGTGLAAAFGILAAVLAARKTGEGEHVDVSMAAQMAFACTPSRSAGEATGQTVVPDFSTKLTFHWTLASLQALVQSMECSCLQQLPP